MPFSGDGAPALLHSLDYPCTTRLRLRRLLAYHRRYSYEPVYNMARDNMTATFDLRDVKNFVKRGMWWNAYTYIMGFLHSGPESYEARVLVAFLSDLRNLNDFAKGGAWLGLALSRWFLKIYDKPLLAAYPWPCFTTLVADALFLRSDHAGAFLNWQRVRNKAAEMVQEMAYKTPELKDKLHFPRGRNNLYHVVPIGSSFHPRRPVKKSLGRQQSIHLAQFYLQLKKRLPSSGPGGSDRFPGMLLPVLITDGAFSVVGSASRGEPFIALLEKALQSGRRLLLQPVHPPEYPSKEGFPLMQMLAKPSFLPLTLFRVHQPEHSSKQDTSLSSAVMASTETDSEVKTMRTEER